MPFADALGDQLAEPHDDRGTAVHVRTMNDARGVEAGDHVR